MNVGMLWFDNDKKSDLTSKVAQAAEYYRRKYGQAPDLCLVHPSMLAGSPAAGMQAGRVALRPNPLILPGHLWIGVDEMR